jgi:hypothetical protein
MRSAASATMKKALSAESPSGGRRALDIFIDDLLSRKAHSRGPIDYEQQCGKAHPLSIMGKTEKVVVMAYERVFCRIQSVTGAIAPSHSASGPARADLSSVSEASRTEPSD